MTPKESIEAWYLLELGDYVTDGDQWTTGHIVIGRWADVQEEDAMKLVDSHTLTHIRYRRKLFLPDGLFRELEPGELIRDMDRYVARDTKLLRPVRNPGAIYDPQDHAPTFRRTFRRLKDGELIEPGDWWENPMTGARGPSEDVGLIYHSSSSPFFPHLRPIP